jgi:Fur family ferric uptake transcriptional regulator
MTKQRQVILEELREFHDHPSADELYERVRKRLPRISLGTVYRNLEVLCELGEIQKHEFGGTLKRFDGNPHLHYHIRCTCCDRVDNVPVRDLTDLEKDLSPESEYKILGYRLEFIGLCPECARNPISPGLKKI